MSPMLALFGHGAMSDLSPQCALKRTSAYALSNFEVVMLPARRSLGDERVAVRRAASPPVASILEWSRNASVELRPRGLISGGLTPICVHIDAGRRRSRIIGAMAPKIAEGARRGRGRPSAFDRDAARE